MFSTCRALQARFGGRAGGATGIGLATWGGNSPPGQARKSRNVTKVLLFLLNIRNYRPVPHWGGAPARQISGMRLRRGESSTQYHRSPSPMTLKTSRLRDAIVL